MKNLFSLLCLISFLFIGTLDAQTYKQSNNIPVYNMAGEKMLYPWAGGMNDAQVHNMDVNLDGTMDILVFEGRVAKFIPYIYVDTSSNPIQFQPEFVSNFDNCECKKWVQVVDYNCDGMNDIICGSGSVGQHYKVYAAKVFNGDSLGFELAIDPVKALDTNSSPAQDREIFVINSDIPSVTDVDFDGDLDIITTQNGFDFWAFYRNVAMERLGRCDTMVFEFGSYCWGHFSEASTDNTLFVADTINCPRGGGPDPIEPRHVGSSILLLDLNADSLYDAILGDVSFPTVSGVINNGTKDWAFMDTSFTDYPSTDSAIDVEIFPGLYYTDVDNDQKKDLIISSHSPSLGEDINGVVFYKNFGENNQPDFRFQNRGFMAKDHIDAGKFAFPVFFDYNQDGLSDILISSRGYIRKDVDTIESNYHLLLYENTGNMTHPEFTLVDDDYLDGKSQFALFENAILTFGDLDGDGDDDMISGSTLGNFAYFRNEAAPGAVADFRMVTPLLKDANGMNIDIGSLSAPELYDYDGDGDLDLFSGDNFGKITYYENIGSPTNFSFNLVTSQWGGINIRFSLTGYEFYGKTKPRFMDYDQDNVVELLLATEEGFVEVYEDISTALTDTITPSFNLFNGDFGEEAAFDAAVLDTSGNLTYIIGDERGGLVMYNTMEFEEPTDTSNVGFPDLTENLPFRLAPNPAGDRVSLLFDTSEIIFAEKEVTLLNQLGQEIVRRSSVSSSRLSLDLSSFPTGLYYVKVHTKDQDWVSKLVHRN